MDTAIEASELVKRYGEVEALRGLSLTVRPGTIFGLLGPNGAGKSTTVRVLCALSRPDRGTARVAGYDVLAAPARVRAAIGVVGQRHGSAPEATARENLELQGQFHGMHGRALTQRIVQTLARFGLTDAADRPVRTYSGGMSRRLDLAMGLLHRPRVLFLDEPTTGLDPEVRAEMWREIAGLAATDSITILLTTHYMEEADQLADRVAIVDRGRIVTEGTPHELKGELQGDTIQLHLGEARAARAAVALAALDGVSDIETDGLAVRARARDGGVALPAILAALARDGVPVASATVARPTLDDVYMRYAGAPLLGQDAAFDAEEALAR
jgi:ABC-2 type transport system ATP-binding protein